MNRLQHVWIVLVLVFFFFTIYCTVAEIPSVNPIIRYANKKYPTVLLSSTGRICVSASCILVPLLLIYPIYVLSYHVARHFSQHP